MRVVMPFVRIRSRAMHALSKEVGPATTGAPPVMLPKQPVRDLEDFVEWNILQPGVFSNA